MYSAQLIMIIGATALLIALLLLAGLFLLFPGAVARFLRKRARDGSGAPGGEPADSAPESRAAGPVSAPVPEGAARVPGAELVAVIAAAVSAASGLHPGQFRIASISSAHDAGGFNTPVWGRVERLSRLRQDNKETWK